MRPLHVYIIAALATSLLGCEEGERNAASTASASAPAPTPAKTATAAPTASADEEADDDYGVTGWKVTLPDGWKRTTDEPDEQRFVHTEASGKPPPRCSLERTELPEEQSDPLELKELESPTVKDPESTETEVAGNEAVDHRFTVEQPGGASKMQIWVRLVDIGEGERISLQCIAGADAFDELKDSDFSTIIESLEASED